MPARRLSLGLCLLAVFALAGCDVFRERYGVSRLEAPSRLPEPRGTYMDLGRQLLHAGQTELAKEAFIRSIRLEGMTAAALTGVGLSYERDGRLHDAQRYFERALVRAPQSVLAHNNLGAALYRQGEYNQAKQAFQAAFALSSGKSRIAQHNLSLTDLAIKRELAESLPIAANPVPLQREGSGEYRLLGAADATIRDADDGAEPQAEPPANKADQKAKDSG